MQQQLTASGVSVPQALCPRGKASVKIVQAAERIGTHLIMLGARGIARSNIGDLRGALKIDGAPPVYYVLLHAWTAVFGDGDHAVRALSGFH